MCSRGYHHNDFVATHAFGHMMYGCTLLVPVNQRVDMATSITLLALLFKHSLVHWNKKCVTVHQVPKCVNCHELIVVITWRKYCFHDCIYIMLILLLRDLSTLCVQKAIVVITGGRVHYFHDCKIGGVIIYGQNIKKILWRTTFFHQVTGYRLQQEEFFYKLRSQRIYILEWLWFTDHLATTYGNIVLKFLYISLFKLIKRNGI